MAFLPQRPKAAISATRAEHRSACPVLILPLLHLGRLRPLVRSGARRARA
jgi:hypothetical protein